MTLLKRLLTKIICVSIKISIIMKDLGRENLIDTIYSLLRSDYSIAISSKILKVTRN